MLKKPPIQVINLLYSSSVRKNTQVASLGVRGGRRGGRVCGAGGQTPDGHVLQPGERGRTPVARARAARLCLLLARVRARARARRARLRVHRRARPLV